MIRSILFCILSLTLFACSSPRERAITEIERVKAEMANDSVAIPDQELLKEGITAYANFYKQFPDDSLTPFYKFQAASLYRAKRDFNTAISLWDDITINHPSSKQAPQSLFLKAFIFENDIRHLKHAEQFYVEFLNKYPSHELASSAEFSLKYLGKPAEEILKDFESKQDTSTLES